MEPGTPRNIRLAVFFFMVSIGLWNLFLNVAARYKEHPFDQINGFPLWALNIMYVYREVFSPSWILN